MRVSKVLRLLLAVVHTFCRRRLLRRMDTLEVDMRHAARQARESTRVRARNQRIAKHRFVAATLPAVPSTSTLSTARRLSPPRARGSGNGGKMRGSGLSAGGIPLIPELDEDLLDQLIVEDDGHSNELRLPSADTPLWSRAGSRQATQRSTSRNSATSGTKSSLVRWHGSMVFAQTPYVCMLILLATSQLKEVHSTQPEARAQEQGRGIQSTPRSRKGTSQAGVWAPGSVRIHGQSEQRPSSQARMECIPAQDARR